MIELLIFVFVGMFVGLSAGLLGIGGGLVSVPLMIFLLPFFNVSAAVIMHMAIATSLALIIPTSVISAYSHWRHNAIEWPVVVIFLPGLLVGGGVGAYVALYMQREMLQMVFAVFLFAIALYMLRAKSSIATAHSVKRQAKAVSSPFLPTVMMGAISSLMGVGGGTMIVPYLLWRGVNLPKAIGSSAACGLPIAISGSLFFFLLKDGDENMIYWPAFVGILVGVIVFTPMGAKLALQLNVVLLKRFFIAMLVIVSLKLFFSN